MSLTYEQAYDDILIMLKEAWDPTGHQMFYESVRDDREDDQSPWASVVVRHANGQTGSLGKDKQMFLRSGTMVVTIHTPLGYGLQTAYQLAKVITDAYEGEHSPNGVWFRNVRINELDPDGTFARTNVVIDFEYNEIK